MITKVKLKNFRSHLNSELDFSRGTNALVGILGSGKSTVMNALTFGLFGTFPDLQTKKVKLDDIIMNKPSVKNQAEVVVDFTIDGKNYSLMRVVERGKGTTYSEIREGDRLLEAPNSQRVTELVEKILKVNYDLFSKAIYSEQNELDYFLTLPKGERMRRIDNLLTIDKFEKARSSTVTLINKLVDRKLGKQSIIEQTDVEELKKLIDVLKEDLDGLKKNKFEVSAEIETLDKTKKELEIELKRLEQLNKDLIYYKEQDKSLESAIEENKKFISEIEGLLKGKTPKDIEDRMKQFSEKIKEIENNIKKKRSEQEKLTELISETKTKIEFLEKDKMKKLESEISRKLSIKDMLVDIRKTYGEKPLEKFDKEKEMLEEIIKKLSSLTTKLSETKTILEQVYELKDHCPVCLSKLTPTKKRTLIEKQKKNIEKIEKEIKVLEKEEKIKKEILSSFEETVDRFKQFLNEVKDLDDLQKQLKELRKLYSKYEKNLESYQKNFNAIKLEISNIQRDLEKTQDEQKNLSYLYSRIPEIEKKKSRLVFLNSRIEDVKRSIDEINKKLKGQDIEKLRKEFTEIVSKKSELEERLKNLSQILKEKEIRKNEEEEKLKMIETQKAEVARLEKTIRDFKIFEKALVNTQTQLRTEFIDAVNYTMNEIWPSIYPYEDFIGVALNIESGDYVLQLKDRMGRWVSADGIASGGERSIACLALRIAFSLVLAPNLKMLILDEPTANLDSRSITELAATLRERINEFIDQTFLITHQRELEDAVTGNAYRIERDKSIDGVTKVSVI
ncbi:MAG: SMC family ATPase [Candidatus Aenigmarchaeota archaeon]|nr:SMC family ATPase [Candidatus Aenigmarchaeota archaeon]